MEQLVILVIIGLISLVNWMMQRSAELRERRKLERQKQGIPEGDPFRQQTPEAPRSPSADPAADMRRLMEALGIPVEDEPPVLNERPAPAPPAKQPQAPPPLPSATPPAPPKRTAPSPTGNPPRPFHIPCASRSPLAESLRDKNQVRQAVVLREILGPPKAFTL